MKVIQENRRFISLISMILLLLGPAGNLSVSPVNGQLIRKGNYNQAESLIAVRNCLTKKALLEVKLLTHTVKKGENLYRLSREYFVSLDTMRVINNINNPDRIEEGLVLFIPPVDDRAPFLQKYRVRPEDTVNSLLKKYNLKLWQFKRLNPLVNQELLAGTTVLLPSEPLKPADSHFYFNKPVKGFLTSRFGMRWGRMHYGLDLAAPVGTPVKAAGSGRVIFAGWMGTYGLLVKIDHGEYCTYYGHLSKIMVTEGRRVKQGAVIALVGATGRAYGSHLHFEVERNGVKVNPYYFIRKLN